MRRAGHSAARQKLRKSQKSQLFTIFLAIVLGITTIVAIKNLTQNPASAQSGGCAGGGCGPGGCGP